MNLDNIIEQSGNSIYAIQAIVAIHATYCLLIVLRRIRQKRFPNSQISAAFLEESRAQLVARNPDGAAQLCDTHPYWSMAVPQLMLLAIQNRKLGLNKVRRLVSERFERDVLTDFDHRLSWVDTAIKSEPMLGLLGTVVGMIAAFAKIAGAQRETTNPKLLANDISLALWTTAVGLTVAIPLIIAVNLVRVRIAALQDAVQQDLTTFLEDLETYVKTEGEAKA